MSTLFETRCAVHWIFAIPRNYPYIRKSKGFLPCFSRALCKVPHHFWVLPVEKIVVILELVNLFQLFLTGSLSIVMHIIGLPFCWVFVTVGNQAAVVPILVHVLHAVKQLTCCYTVLLIFQPQPQLQKIYSYSGKQWAKKQPTFSSKTLCDFPFGSCEEG